ncbi:uncharacterized protein LOC135379199 [Ornithodoros turicata]|uniref:uncharacterized protein LOC135379199 n=1 Tax=Ornithodoros turicata TaxID=34597 RepID=UPI003138A923
MEANAVRKASGKAFTLPVCQGDITAITGNETTELAPGTGEVFGLFGTLNRTGVTIPGFEGEPSPKLQEVELTLCIMAGLVVLAAIISCMVACYCRFRRRKTCEPDEPSDWRHQPCSCSNQSPRSGNNRRPTEAPPPPSVTCPTSEQNKKTAHLHERQPSHCYSDEAL